MSWGTLTFSDEIRQWLIGLSMRDQGRADSHINRLAAWGPALHAPHARHLGGKLWELRFHLSTDEWRVTYTIAPNRQILLLTVFAKTRQRETFEVARAKRAMTRLLGEDHG